MSTATQLMTADEFFEWANRPENVGKHYELERGMVIEMPRPGERHSVICANVAFVLGSYVRLRISGRVLSNDPGIVLERDPDTLRGPDAALFLESRKYEDLNPKFLEEMPELVVEVLSPSDRHGAVTRRVTDYLNAGVRLVWVIDPDVQEVTVHRTEDDPYVLGQKDELTGDDVLPDFRCRVADFFFTTER